MPEVCFAGPFGRIEGKYHQNPDPTAPVAMLLPPSPASGATMNNDVIYNLYKVFVKTGFTVLRINYPGVGKSEPKPGGGGEFPIINTAMDWLQQGNPEASHYWAIGYEFGALMAMYLTARRPEIENFILISPNPNHDYTFSCPCPAAGLVIVAGADRAATLTSTKNLISQWQQQSNHVVTEDVISNATRLFRDTNDPQKHYLDQITAACEKYINTTLALRIVIPIRKKRRRRRKKDKRVSELEGDWES